jgi:hypothetical protein
MQLCWAGLMPVVLIVGHMATLVELQCNWLHGRLLL